VILFGGPDAPAEGGRDPGPRRSSMPRPMMAGRSCGSAGLTCGEVAGALLAWQGHLASVVANAPRHWRNASGTRCRDGHHPGLGSGSPLRCGRNDGGLVLGGGWGRCGGRLIEDRTASEKICSNRAKTALDAKS